LGAHVGAVRSYELGGHGTTAGRRWAARCSCGAMATTGAWPEALAYLSEHRRITAELRMAWMASHPGPDLRTVEYWHVDWIEPNGNGNGRPARGLKQLVAGFLQSVARFVLGVPSVTTS
jgi:hypothetical protein